MLNLWCTGTHWYTWYSTVHMVLYYPYYLYHTIETPILCLHRYSGTDGTDGTGITLKRTLKHNHKPTHNNRILTYSDGARPSWG
jgi:hypothetical protein